MDQPSASSIRTPADPYTTDSLRHAALGYGDARCNYANSLILIGRIMGTCREGGSSIVGQNDRRRLSIREQFMFPFQPAVDTIRARMSKSSMPAPN